MPTLNKPSAGDTDWTTEINDNWTALENQLKNAFQGRLEWSAGTPTQVTLHRYIGDVVEVNGANVSLGAGGIALTTSDNLINSTGGDAGSAMAASTLYYVYLSNASSSPFPSDLRASTTAPTYYNGVKYLGTSGNAANWRFVGYVRTNGSTQFVDSETQRLVINYYNRRQLRLKLVETDDSWTYTSLTWRAWNNDTSNTVEAIANGEDPVSLTFYAPNKNANVLCGCAGIDVDYTSGTPVNDADIFPGGSYSGVGTGHGPAIASYFNTISEGYHSFMAIESVELVSGTTTWIGDKNTPTQFQAGMIGWVMG